MRGGKILLKGSNDPHVAAILYRIEHSTAFSYENAQPLSCDLPEFRIRIEGGQAIVEPKQHFATAEEAREVVEPVLWAWKLDAALKHDGNALQFVYQHAVVTDRVPPPGSAAGVSAGRAMVRGMATAVHGQYPAPPSGLTVKPGSEVQAMFEKWSRYKAGQAELADTANFCLTALEGKDKTKGRRTKAERSSGSASACWTASASWRSASGSTRATAHPTPGPSAPGWRWHSRNSSGAPPRPHTTGTPTAG
jgi:hypothetical protein